MLAKFIGIGNLTQNPELRHTPKGHAVCTMRIAFNRVYKDANGDRKQETVYLDVVAWRRQAETCNKHLEKGRQVFIEGHHSQDHWDDKDTGKKREKVFVTAERILFLGGKGANGSEASAGDEVALEPEPTEVGF